jgi:hypothetical protein
MLTLTVRHHLGQPLSELLRGLSDSWRTLLQGRAGQKLSDTWDHVIRAVDCTFGEHGWHTHLHVLVLYRGEGPSREAVSDRWRTVVAQILGPDSVPRADDVGVHWTPRMGKLEYLAKLGLEVASDGKVATDGNLNPWDVARLAATMVGVGHDHPLFEALKHREIYTRAWREWCLACKGRRQLTMSKGCRKLAELAPLGAVESDASASEDSPRWIARLANSGWSLLTHPMVGVSVWEIHQRSAESEDSFRELLARAGWSLELDEISDSLFSTGEFVTIRKLRITRRSCDDEERDLGLCAERAGPPAACCGVS